MYKCTEGEILYIAFLKILHGQYQQIDNVIDSINDSIIDRIKSLKYFIVSIKIF